MRKTERAGLRGIKQREFGFENVKLKVLNIYLGRDIQAVTYLRLRLKGVIGARDRNVGVIQMAGTR